MALHQGYWRLYLNGIEVPALSVDIQLGTMSIPSATISLPPDRELIRLGSEDRVQVAVFYLDDVQTKNEGVSPDYRLIFEGEVDSWGYSNAGLNRSIQLRATGHAAVLGLIHPDIMKNEKDIAQASTGNTAADARFASPVYPTSLFYYGLDHKQGPIKRPYDLVENIFKALFGLVEFKSINSASSVHFFARWCRRTNFLNRWAPSPYLEGQDLALSAEGIFPVMWALRSKGTVDSFANLATQVASGSLWEMIASVFQKAYYEFTMLPNMPLVTYDLATGAVLGPASLGIGEGVAAATDDVSDGVVRGRGPKDPSKPLRLLSHVTKPQLQYCAVPRCNIILPSMITGYSFSEDFAQQPTRLYYGDETREAHYTSGANANFEIIGSLLRAGYPAKVRKFLQAADKNVMQSDRNFLLFPEEFYKGPVVLRRMLPEWFMFLASSLALTAKEQARLSGLDSEAAYMQTLKQITDIYAEYEYIKERGSMRSGAVTMRFNPYVVPGFPAVIMDREDTNVHVFCYVQNVTHSLSNTGLSTTLNYAFAQTFDEFFETLAAQRAGMEGRQPLPAAQVLQAQQALREAEFFLDEVTDGAAGGGSIEALKAAGKKVEEKRRALETAQSQALAQQYTELAAAQAAYEKVKSEANNDTSDAVTQAESRLTRAREAVVMAQDALVMPEMAPAHPIPDVRVRFQNLNNADQYYTMLFQRGESQGKRAVFDWTEMLGVLDAENPYAAPKPIKLDNTVETTVAAADGENVTVRTVSTNAIRSGYAGYTLRGPYRELMTDSELAMAYVARPIITLEEYIDFHGDRGVRRSPVTNDGPRYYVKILDLKQGPGTDPGEDNFGNPDSVVLEDTRRDWEIRLLNYRAKVRSALSFTA